MNSSAEDVRSLVNQPSLGKRISAVVVASLLSLLAASFSNDAGALVKKWGIGSATQPPYDESAGVAADLANQACKEELGPGAYADGLTIHGTWNQIASFHCFINGYGAGWTDGGSLEWSCKGDYWLVVDGEEHIKQDECNPHSKDDCGPCNAVGNPIHPGYGNKFEQQVDFQGAGLGPLRFERAYNSLGPMYFSVTGSSWTSSLDRNLRILDESTANVFVHRSDGKILKFVLMKDGVAVTLSPYDPLAKWVSDADVNDVLTRVVDGTGATLGWTYYVGSTEELETYNASGKITSITTREGATNTVAYDAQGRISSYSDPFGRALTFAYNSKNLIQSVTDPAGQIYTYTYDSKFNLTDITYPGQATRHFVYNEPSLTQSADLPYHLTGIVDELGARFATFSFDASGRAISTEHAGGVERFSITYNGNSSSVTDPLGTSRTYNFTTVLGVMKNTGMSQPCSYCRGGAFSAATYDSSGNATSRVDFRGMQTCYAYDPSRNLETARVEGALSSEGCSNVLATLPNRPDVRKISTQWHALWRLPVKMAEPNRITTFVYNGDVVNGTATYCAPTNATVNGNPIGVLCSKSIQETTDPSGQQGLGATVSGAARTWSYTYNQFGQVLTATDPNGKTTTTAYYAADDADLGKRGNVSTITNALGHVTNVTSYDAVGRPLSVTDPNGVVTTMTYHPRGWLTSKTVGGETTAYEYDATGQLKKVTLPDSSFIQYTYDDAHRLKQIQDGMGNKVVYTLDALGNRVKEEAFDPNNQLAKVKQQVFDSLNRLHQSVGAQ